MNADNPMGAASLLVSVIIPAYNYAAFVAEALASALQQSHSNIEVIVVDDGSTDNTAAVVQEQMKRDSRVQYIHQHNQGLSAARNTGIRHSRGDYLVFLDADDVMHAQKVAVHLEHFSREPETGISYGRCRYFLNGRQEQTFASLQLDDAEWMPCVSGRAAEVMPLLVVNNIMPVCSVMLRREVVKRVGGFNTALKSLEDWEYWLRAAALDFLFSYCNDDRLAAYIRVHDVSMSQNALRMLQVQYRLRLDNIPGFLSHMQDRRLEKALLRDNAKRRLRCLVTIARETGICHRDFIQLCQGESPAILLRMLSRLLRHRK